MSLAIYWIESEAAGERCGGTRKVIQRVAACAEKKPPLGVRRLETQLRLEERRRGLWAAVF